MEREPESRITVVPQYQSPLLLRRSFFGNLGDIAGFMARSGAHLLLLTCRVDSCLWLLNVGDSGKPRSHRAALSPNPSCSRQEANISDVPVDWALPPDGADLVPSAILLTYHFDTTILAPAESASKMWRLALMGGSSFWMVEVVVNFQLFVPYI